MPHLVVSFIERLPGHLGPMPHHLFFDVLKGLLAFMLPDGLGDRFCVKLRHGHVPLVRNCFSLCPKVVVHVDGYALHRQKTMIYEDDAPSA
jgi:hypothetical protein